MPSPSLRPSPSRARRRARAAALWLALVATAPGCGALALTHDKMLGPVSPAGRIHPLAVGGEFRLSRQGPVADDTGAHPFRIFPQDPLRRLFSLPRVMLQGFTFYVGFLFRYVGQFHVDVGQAPDPAALRELERAPEPPSSREVLRRIGPPRQWIKRAEWSLMVYSAEVLRELSLAIGVPPGVGTLIPIPGVAEVLRFDYSTLSSSTPRAMLFFDREERLIAVVRGGGLEEEEAE